MDMTSTNHEGGLTLTAEGIVRVESGTLPPPVFRSSLELPGGVAIFDVSDLGSSPSATIDDPVAARPWVARVFGDPLAEALSAVDLDVVGATTRSTGIPFVPTSAGAVLSRIALGQWLWRYWPLSAEVSPIDEPLLRLELAALAWELDDCFLSLQPASTYLNGQLDALRAIAETFTDAPPSALGSPLGKIVLGALDAAVVGPAGALASQDEALLDHLDNLLGELVAAQDEQADAPDASHEGTLVELDQWLRNRSENRDRLVAALRADYALAASAGDLEPESPEPHGEGSVDWLQVPPRVLDWNESTVSWVAEPVDGVPGTWLVQVAVRGVPVVTDATQPVLFVRGYLPDGTPSGELPVLVIPLASDGDFYVGSGRLADGRIRSLRLDVYSADSVMRPVIAEEPRSFWRQQRDAAREFMKQRDAGLGYSTETDDPSRPFVAEADQQ